MSLKLKLKFSKTIRQTRPVAVYRASLPSLSRLMSEFIPGLFDHVHLPTHLASLCVDVPRE
jgi:hypothetical protein